MKCDASIDATLTLPGVTRPVGRPRKPDAKTPAQRSRLYRQKKAISVTRHGNSENFPSEDEILGLAWWEGLPDWERKVWSNAADSATPADAWMAFKRVQA